MSETTRELYARRHAESAAARNGNGSIATPPAVGAGRDGTTRPLTTREIFAMRAIEVQRARARFGGNR